MAKNRLSLVDEVQVFADSKNIPVKIKRLSFGSPELIIASWDGIPFTLGTGIPALGTNAEEAKQRLTDWWTGRKVYSAGG